MYLCPMHSEVRQDHPGSCPKCGMALEAEGSSVEEDHSCCELAAMSQRFWTSLVLTLPVVIVSMWHMQASRWDPPLELILATPVVFWGGWPFFDRARQSIVNRSPNMFPLIAMGSEAASFYSFFPS